MTRVTHGELLIEGRIVQLPDGFAFAFVVTGECGNPDCTEEDQRHVFASKEVYPTEDEAVAMLQYAVQHFVLGFKKNVEGATGKEIGLRSLNYGQIPIDLSGKVH